MEMSLSFELENTMNLKSALPMAISITLVFTSLSATALAPKSIVGEVAPPTAARRTISIDDKTKYVNVTGNETVKFEVSGREFAVYFSDGSAMFDLNQVAPAGVLNHKVTAYVAPDPLYLP
jgi:Heavy-metal resistance protein CzcE